MHAKNRPIAIAAAAALLIAAACGSKSTSSTGSDTSTTTPHGDGTGPCATSTQEACQECVDAATKVCNEAMCKAQDLDLQNCAVMAVYNPCEGPYGEPSLDCCKLFEQALIACWGTCPEMQKCS